MHPVSNLARINETEVEWFCCYYMVFIMQVFSGLYVFYHVPLTEDECLKACVTQLRLRLVAPTLILDAANGRLLNAFMYASWLKIGI